MNPQAVHMEGVTSEQRERDVTSLMYSDLFLILCIRPIIIINDILFDTYNKKMHTSPQININKSLT
jgi:hypothetical protein